jgi:hypothetical protein
MLEESSLSMFLMTLSKKLSMVLLSCFLLRQNDYTINTILLSSPQNRGDLIKYTFEKMRHFLKIFNNLRAAWIVAVLAFACFGFAAVWFGALNQDEGWYLYAAQSVCEGKMPYRDFFYTQGPVMPYVYSVFAPIGSLFHLLCTEFWEDALLRFSLERRWFFSPSL